MYQEERLGPRASGGLWVMEEGKILSIHLGFTYYSSCHPRQVDAMAW